MADANDSAAAGASDDGAQKKPNLPKLNVNVDRVFLCKVLNVLSGLLLFIAGIISLTFGFFQSIIIGLYAMFFGVLLIVLEFKDNYNIPFANAKGISFLQSLFARGFFYIFWGFLYLNVFRFTFHTFVAMVLLLGGIMYIVAHFVYPSLLERGSPCRTEEQQA